MDAIDLMAIKPWQIRQALGKDRIKIIRGSRQVYNSRQNRSRRNGDMESNDEKSEEVKSIWKCTDVACGGVVKRRIKVHTTMTDNECQTDPQDMQYYWETKEMLQSHNVTILTGTARDIQKGSAPEFQRKGSNISILQSGSLTSVGAQTNAGKEEPKKSKANKFFADKFSRIKKYFKDFMLPPQPVSEEEDTSEDDEIPENEPEERDHEWLEHTASEQSRDDMQRAYEANLLENPPPPRRIELECHYLISSIKPLLWLMKLGGRWPFETYIEDRLVKFCLNRWSFNFIIFCLMTVFLLMWTCHCIVSTILLVSSASTTHSYEQDKLEVLFNKYWPYAFVTIFYTVYAGIWSLAVIFDDGRFLADFMSRWNLGVVKINYNPCEGVRTELWLSLGFLIIYFISMICFFIWDLIPAVRGTSELLGVLMLRRLVAENNLNKYVNFVRIFGLVFHLYAVYSTRIITLLVIMYSKFLENLARRWNLRFCYVTGMLGRFEPPHRYTTYHTVIPYTKLFHEHKLILAFSRHTGKVFTITLLAYYLTKGMEIMMLAYRTCCLGMFTEHVERNETSLRCPPNDKKCQPITYDDEPVFVVMTLLYLTCQSITGWYLTTDSITACGAAVMSGFNFVRRYGFPRSKNAKERRFIQSLVFAFSPISHYYIHCGFTINRKFTYEMFAWVFALTSMLVAFSPFQLDTEPLTICHESENGSLMCFQTQINRLERLHLIKFAEENLPGSSVLDKDDLLPLSANTTTTIPTTIATTTTTASPTVVPPIAVVVPITTVPPIPITTIPPITTVPIPTLPPTVVTPIIVAPPGPLAVKPYFECDKVVIPVACTLIGGIISPLKPFKTGAGNCYNPSDPNHSMLSKPFDESHPNGLHYCETPLPKMQIDPDGPRDDCLNLPFFSPTSLSKAKFPKVAVEMTLPDKKGATTQYYCCCYDYDWYVKLGTTASMNNCATTEKQADKFCNTEKKCVEIVPGASPPTC